MKRRVLAIIATLAIMLTLASAAVAGPATDTVKDKQSALFALLAAPTPDQKKIAAIFDQMLDYGALATESLGKEGATLTEAQRKQFADLLKQLVQQAYEKNLKKTVNFDVSYVEENDLGNKTFLVKTKAKPKNDNRADPIEIDFKLVQKDDNSFKIIDIITEDVSLVDSYRAQFTKVLKNDGFDALVKKMQEKISKGS